MRPLILISSLARGGAERVTTAFVKRMHSSGLSVAVSTLYPDQDNHLAFELDKSGVERLSLDGSRLASPPLFSRYLRLLRSSRMDLARIMQEP